MNIHVGARFLHHPAASSSPHRPGKKNPDWELYLQGSWDFAQESFLPFEFSFCPLFSLLMIHCQVMHVKIRENEESCCDSLGFYCGSACVGKVICSGIKDDARRVRSIYILAERIHFFQCGTHFSAVNPHRLSDQFVSVHFDHSFKTQTKHRQPRAKNTSPKVLPFLEHGVNNRTESHPRISHIACFSSRQGSSTPISISPFQHSPHKRDKMQHSTAFLLFLLPFNNSAHACALKFY